uniref:NADH-ubiquinone oxidoreductase chain 6 n=2 Tax=Scarabaeoidea TaxID=75546 RepID=A0A0S2MRX1_DORPA|nr:NADH dehydrogenase subunit 6 [Cheironitis sp. MJTNT-2012]ALO77481.1 NADH deshydrogenase subunit 6 [Dorcus parallelipipedus]ANJ70386.1 NADH dehydrogenase subunit 6 [Dorcus parallelipipedus]UPX88750.1 NADH dehydrogenase subunit 6 [Dorcus parallelipipedus]
MTTVFLMSMMPAMLLPLMKHPLSMGVLLLIQATMIALITGWMNLTFWYSYILLLIMIGGMLVLFMYMTSVASNEKFKYSLPLAMMYLLLIITLIIFSISTDQWFMNSGIMISENLKLIFSLLSLNKFLNFPAIMISVLLIIYLLITLIVVIKIASFKQGPLRNYN